MRDQTSILKYAMQMELDGYNFFKEKAEKFSNPTCKALFEKLAEVEMEHYEFIKEQLEEYTRTNSFKTVSESVINRERDIFAEREEKEYLKQALAESDIPDLTILRMAYLIEKDYAEFYRNAAKVCDSDEARIIYEALAKWEDGHEELFRQEYERRMKEYMNLPWGG